MRKCCQVLILGLLGLSALAQAGNTIAGNIRYDLDKVVYHLERNGTYSADITTVRTILTPAGIAQLQKESKGYFPKYQRLRLLEAQVVEPGGKHIVVSPRRVYTLNSPKSAGQPEFLTQLTKTVVFPRLQVGSQVITTWRVDNFGTAPSGISLISANHYQDEIKNQTIILYAPSHMKLRWKARGPFKVQVISRGYQQEIKASLHHQPAHLLTGLTVSEQDLTPLFMVSTIPSWQSIGNEYWFNAKHKAAVTPSISKLAHQLVGTEKGLDAVRALYSWVTNDINYVAVYTKIDGGQVPHYADDVVKNGYGDCKDKATLLESLLRAIGVDSEAVLVGWNNSYLPLPLPSSDQFNHVMVYLPRYHLYLNPTAKYTPFGELGVSLRHKFVVHATEVSHTDVTPSQSASHAAYSLQNNMKLKTNGDLVGSGVITAKNGLTMIKAVFDNTAVKRRAVGKMLAMTREGGEGSADKILDTHQTLRIKTHWLSRDVYSGKPPFYFSVPEGVDFFSLQYLNEYIANLSLREPVIVGREALSWHYKIHLPAGIKINRLPKAVAVKNKMGSYFATYRLMSGNQLMVARHLTFNRDVYQPKDFPVLHAVLLAATQDSRQVIPLH